MMGQTVNLAPVSYTHLDVYKRQTIGDCLDFIQEHIDSQKKQQNAKPKARRACQDDFDNF